MAYSVSYDCLAIDHECFDGYVYIVARIITDLDGTSGSDGKYFKNDSFIEDVANLYVRIIPELGGDCRAFRRRVWPDRRSWCYRERRAGRGDGLRRLRGA